MIADGLRANFFRENGMTQSKKKAIMLSVQVNNACYNVKEKVKGGAMSYLLSIDQRHVFVHQYNRQH